MLYGFDAGSQLTSGSLELDIFNWYKRIEVSFDGTTYHEVYQHEADGNRLTWKLNLSSVPRFTENTGKVWVRLSGSDSYTGGYGISLYSIAFKYRLMDDTLYEPPKGIS